MPEVRTKSSTGGEKGTKLARFDLIPVGPLTELAEHYGRGAAKYANHQWRQGYEWSKSYSALMRHLTAFWAGYDYDVCSNDPEGCSHVDAKGEPFESVGEDTCFNHTGSHHMAAVAWHAFLLLEFKDAHQGHDDRYRPEPTLTQRADDLVTLTEAGMVDPAPESTRPYVARWVEDYDAETGRGGRRPGDFPRVETGLTPLAEAVKFGQFEPGEGLADFQDVISREVRRRMLAEDAALEERLRDQLGPDLLRKRSPIDWSGRSGG